MIRFVARFQTTTSVGCASYETENEMYVCLECEGIIEDDPRVVGIDYYELVVSESGECIVSRQWDFGKPYLTDYWRKCQTA